MQDYHATLQRSTPRINQTSAAPIRAKRHLSTSGVHAVLRSCENPGTQHVALSRTSANSLDGLQAILYLQRNAGNRSVQRAIARAGQVQRSTVPTEVQESIERKKGAGGGLDSSIRLQMENAFGADFSGVRVHTDAESSSLNDALGAVAFTTGQDIFFREGAYNAQSSAGRELLAHELTHVVQQSSGTVQGQWSVSEPHDADELEAEAMSKAVTRMVDSSGTAATVSREKAACACGGHCSKCAGRGVARMPADETRVGQQSSASGRIARDSGGGGRSWWECVKWNLASSGVPGWTVGILSAVCGLIGALITSPTGPGAAAGGLSAAVGSPGTELEFAL